MKKPQKPGGKGEKTESGQDALLGPVLPVVIIPPADRFDINEVFLSETEVPEEEPSTELDEPAEAELPPIPQMGSAPVERFTTPLRSVETTERRDFPPAPSQALIAYHHYFSDNPDQPALALSIAELLENGVVLDWSEAVAIAQRICRAVAQSPGAGAQQCLLDVRHVAITERGDVRVLPGPPGGDPLVKQIGRILRLLLEGIDAPVQLRLLAAHAAFEVPVFLSIEQLSEALRQFEQPGGANPIRTAFKRGLEAKFSAPAEHVARAAAPSPPPVDPGGKWTTQTVDPSEKWPQPRQVELRFNVGRRALLSRSTALLAMMLLLGVAAVVVLPLISRSGPSDRPQDSPRAEAPQVAAVPNVAPAPPPSSASAAPPTRPVSASPGVPVQNTSAATRPANQRTLESVSQVDQRPRVTATVPSVGRSAAPPIQAAAPGGQPQTTPIESVGATPVPATAISPRQPAAADLPSEAATALQAASRRLLVPVIARRDYERALAALEAGDYDLALLAGTTVAKTLEDRDNAGQGDDELRRDVQQLLERASALKALEDGRVYTMSDEGVLPPVALSRQLPVGPPPGLSRHMVGTLDLLINQEGTVEIVRLYTPLNRYHERMIVSAAKAWRYKPASKEGRPVKFRIVSPINLPES
jgi:hypothetical protein